MGMLNVYNKSTLGNLYFDNNSTVNTITIIDSILDNFRFDLSKCDKLYLNECLITQNFVISQNSQLENIVFKKCNVFEILDILNAAIELLDLTHCQFGEIKINKSSIINLQIKECVLGWVVLKESIISSAKILYSSILGIDILYLKHDSKRLVIQNCLIDVFIVTLDKPLEITVNDSTIWTLNLAKKILIKDTIFRLSDCQFNQIIFDSFTNQGTISFSNIKVFNEGKNYKSTDNIVKKDPNSNYMFESYCRNSEIKILNSDMGKTNFIGCNLNQFHQFIFLNSKLLEIFIADTSLPKKEKIRTTETKVSRYEKLEQTRLALSQFKKIYENRGDVVMAIEYHAQEMEVYRQCLKYAESSLWTDRWNIRGERANLWLNKISSYYGNNWLRAVLVTIIVNTFFFIIYCWSLGYCLGTDYKKFAELFSYSFEFLNPVRKSNLLSDNLSPLSRTIDYLSRIIIAYCVYQTIQAFRKFGKKSI